MKLKIVEGYDSELFEADKTQVATLEINRTLLQDEDIIMRARELVTRYGSNQALKEFELAIKRRIDNE